MSFLLKANAGGGFEKPPAGNHPAALVAIVDLGTQHSDFQGEGRWQRKVFLVWELLGEKQSGMKDRNHVIGIDLTFSLNEKAKLRKWIESRLGSRIPNDAEYDIGKELGQKCLLNVVNNNKGYPRIEGVGSVPRGIPIPDPQNKPVSITLEDIQTGTPIPDWIPPLYGELVSAHIARCKELGGTAPNNGPGTGAANVPF